MHKQMKFVKRYYCICCEGEQIFQNCPLCDDDRIFEEECDEEMQDFMVDFYSETVLHNTWSDMSYEQKLRYLNEELEKYMKKPDAVPHSI